MKKLIAMILVLCMVLTMFAGCGEEEKVLDKYVDTDFADMSWEEILLEADGQTVNWYLWGGGTSTNSFIDDIIAPIMKEEYNVTINRVGVTDVSQAVNIVISEKTAGADTNGTVDIFWINGTNFMSMVEADVTFKDWAETLPNAEYVDWTDYSIAYDMGYPVDGQESPWMKAQLQIVYDSAVLDESELPRSYEELLEFAKANPGEITYVAPPEFIGTRFIKAAIYELTGGYEQYTADDITYDEFYEMSSEAWDYFEELNQYLWRDGETYAASSSDANSLLSNGEILFAFTMDGMGISSQIEAGQLPSTAKVYCMDTSIADTNYVALTYNGANKAAALVLANLLLEPEIQAANITAQGGGPVLDPSTLTDAQNQAITDASNELGEGTYVSTEEKADTAAPEISSYLNTYIEDIWTDLFGS